MRTNLRMAMGVAAILGAPVLASAGELADAIPSEARLAILVEDAGGLATRFKASKYFELWNSPECAGLREVFERKFGELARQMQEEAESEVPLDKLVKLLTREGVFYVESFPRPVQDAGGADPVPHAVIAFDLDEDSRGTVDKLIEEQLAELPADARRSTYEVGGTTVYSLHWVEEEEVQDTIQPMGGESGAPRTQLKRQVPTTLQYAHVGNRFALGFGESEPLRRYLGNLAAGGGDATLAKSEGYLKARALSGITSPDVTVYVNYPALIADSTPKEGPGAEEMRRNFRGLGLSDAGPALMAFSMEGSGARWALANSLPAEKKGLFSLVYNQPSLDTGVLSSVPGGAGMAVAWSLDGSTLMRDVRALLLAVSPEGYGGLDMVFGMARSQSGVDFERDVIGQLGGSHVYYRNLLSSEELTRTLSAGAGETQLLPLAKSVLRLGFVPGSPVASTLASLFDKLMNDPESPAPLERSEIQGFATFRPKAEAGLPGEIFPSVTLSPGAMVVSFDESVLQDALRRLAGTSTESFAQNRHVAASLSSIDRGDLKAYTFSTEEANIENYDIQTSQLRKLAEEGIEDPDTADLFRAMPPASVLKGRVGDTWSAFWTRPDGIVLRSESVFR